MPALALYPKLKLVDGAGRRAPSGRPSGRDGMRKRKDVDAGKDVPPARAWANYARELHAEIVDSMTERRLRDGIAPSSEDAPPPA